MIHVRPLDLVLFVCMRTRVVQVGLRVIKSEAGWRVGVMASFMPREVSKHNLYHVHKLLVNVLTRSQVLRSGLLGG